MYERNDDRGCKGCMTSRWLKGGVTFLGIACSIGVILSAAFDLIETGKRVKLKGVIAAVFQIMLGLTCLFAELRIKNFLKWFRFLIPFFGFGVYYVIVAFHAIQAGLWWQVLVAAVTAFVGCMYMLFGLMGQDRNINMDTVDQATFHDSVATKLAREERERAVAAALAQQEREASVKKVRAEAEAAAKKISSMERGEQHADAKYEEEDEGAASNPFEANNAGPGGSAYPK